MTLFPSEPGTVPRIFTIFNNVSGPPGGRSSPLSPERMYVYFAKAKRMPAKTAEFIDFLKTSLGS